MSKSAAFKSTGIKGKSREYHGNRRLQHFTEPRVFDKMNDPLCQTLRTVAITQQFHPDNQELNEELNEESNEEEEEQQQEEIDHKVLRTFCTKTKT